MANSFIKLNRESELADLLAIQHPNAFILLYFIAKRARRTAGSPDGLGIGECHIGDWEPMGLTERKYRTAKEVLCQRNIIKIIETNRTRKKSTTGTTTKGTKVKLLDSDIWDINPDMIDDSKDVRPTTDRRLTDDEQECKNVKNAKNNNNEEADASVAVVFPFLKGLGLSEKEVKSLMAYRTEEGLKHAVAYSNTVPFKDTLVKQLMWAADKMPEIPETIDIAKNKKIAEEFEESWHSPSWKISACRSEIEFIPQGVQMESIICKYEEKGFEAKVLGLINKFEFTRLELYKTKQGAIV